MDTATLVSALQHTLSPDKATRQQAEAALSQVRAARARCPSLPQAPAPRRETPGLPRPVVVYSI